MKYHPIFNAYGAGDYLNNLRGEFYEIPQSLRSKWIRKSLQRTWLLTLTGQTCLEKQRIPVGVKRILWFYDWNTLGDSIMDLSQRQYLSDRYQVDICMPNGPAELFTGDHAFDHVYTDINQCPPDYDFILLHDISSRSIGIKLRRYPTKPWASMIRHQQGEQYARGALSALRFSQLLGVPHLKPLRPTLATDHSQSSTHGIRIAIALGGGDPRRRYYRWPELLARLQQALTRDQQLKFLLIGSGPAMQEDLDGFSTEFLAAHCDIHLDLPSLQELRSVMCSATHFIGCDSGLMHMAEALDKLGLAMFGHIRPEWRLLPESRIFARFDPLSVNNMSPAEIAAECARVIQKDKTS